MSLHILAIIATAYLIGAIPTASIVGAYHGLNLRLVGDGNLGTRNTFKILGWKAGMIVGLIDVSKGAFATWMALSLSSDPLVPYLAALAAALGHDFSIYIHFHGGQGMATNLGGLYILQPRETLVCVSIFVIVYILFHNWDAAWAIGMASMLAAGWVWKRPAWQLVMLILLLVSIGFKKLLDLSLLHHVHHSHS